MSLLVSRYQVQLEKQPLISRSGLLYGYMAQNRANLTNLCRSHLCPSDYNKGERYQKK